MTPSDDRRHKRRIRPEREGRLPVRMRMGATVLMAAMLASCHGSATQLNDDEQIVQSVLGLLASTGRQVCTDDQTEEQALAIYREMTLAPRPSRADLRWFPPTPLWPDTRVTTAELRGVELGNDKIQINQPPPRRDALPGLTQLELDGAAHRLMRSVSAVNETVSIRRAWTPTGVVARWWPLNRLRKSCWPLFSLSNPVRDRQAAFVTVRAEHWGTLYALQQVSGKWQVVGEWSRWLY